MGWPWFPVWFSAPDMRPLDTFFYTPLHKNLSDVNLKLFLLIMCSEVCRDYRVIIISIYRLALHKILLKKWKKYWFLNPEIKIKSNVKRNWVVAKNSNFLIIFTTLYCKPWIWFYSFKEISMVYDSGLLRYREWKIRFSSFAAMESCF